MQEENTKQVENQDEFEDVIVPHELANDSVDLDDFRDEKCRKAFVEIFKILAENADALYANTKDPKEKLEAVIDKVGQQVLNALIDAEVPDNATQWVSDNIQARVYTLFKVAQRQKEEFEKELLARVIQVRNPKEGRFDRGYATLGNLFQTLIKIREEGGNKVEDYYPVTKRVKKENPDMPVEEVK